MSLCESIVRGLMRCDARLSSCVRLKTPGICTLSTHGSTACRHAPATCSVASGDGARGVGESVGESAAPNVGESAAPENEEGAKGPDVAVTRAPTPLTTAASATPSACPMARAPSSKIASATAYAMRRGVGSCGGAGRAPSSFTDGAMRRGSLWEARCTPRVGCVTAVQFDAWTSRLG